MDMSGEYRIPAPRQRVWEALNDPDTLKEAIPGCDELNKTSDNELEAKVTAKIGPVKAKFSGHVTLSNLNPPESYTISGEGKGGAAGFAKGGADVALEEDGDATVLRYTAKADVGGKLAQIGSRLVQGSAKKMADDFFGRLTEIVSTKDAGAVEAAAAAPSVAEEAELPKAAEAPPAPPVTETAAPATKPTPAAPQPEAQKEESKGLSPIMWVGIAAVVLILLYMIF